jgi:hypothetical protein
MMINETQESISEWAEEAFGPVSSNARVAARANEELAELLRALSTDDNSPKAAEEAADVAIVLYRLRARMGFAPAFVKQSPDFLAVNNLHAATGANYGMEHLLRLLARDDGHANAEYFIRLVFVGLNELAARMGFNLAEEVDRKMAVNRSRVWNLDGSGHGYHVREKVEVG